ncbi:hypothetical protein PIROE2DRAFT_5652 [Piromyces sp. E2]|nr:hypothetical protein PIROE2DRAFT_5652 [Piromyces sp. E2]|eukprot:OUM67040.1 hypothetical protein PIROE2DRAFT_5652 [Piromyces sp. E2]
MNQEPCQNHETDLELLEKNVSCISLNSSTHNLRNLQEKSKSPTSKKRNRDSEKPKPLKILEALA